ncbi:MAG TPA: hypothetical protein VHZ96_26265 [Frankiaceae bacterium]|jgi:hypothetical protein|nr:hypothetical protein [Frankiaceae bacterium]
MSELKKCRNDLCDRQVRTSVAYCCNACSLADEGSYEIHESGFLGHPADCNARHAERGAWLRG